MEDQAANRRARLRAMREAAQDTANSEPSTTASEDPVLKFRNYEPTSEELPVAQVAVDTDALAENIVEDAIKQAEEEDVIADVTQGDTVEDVLSLAPRKVDWDLKRDLAPKMAKLEKRSKRAIAEIIRSRLQDGDEASKFAQLQAKAGTN